jgi:hypothetical protein
MIVAAAQTLTAKAEARNAKPRGAFINSFSVLLPCGELHRAPQ